MKVLMGLIVLLGLPIMLLNMFSVIIGSIWLAILGEWYPLLISIGVGIFGVFFIGMLMIPGVLVMLPAAPLIEKDGFLKAAGYILLFISLVWTYAVICAWGFGWFLYYMPKLDGDNDIPMLLVAYGVVSGPWNYMAQKERNEHSSLTAFFINFAAASFLIGILVLDMQVLSAVILFLIIISIGLIFSLTVAAAEILSRRGAAFKSGA